MKSLMALPLLCVGSLLLGTSAQADEYVSYSYADLSYVRSSADLGPFFGDADGDGGRFDFSLEIANNFYVAGGYEIIDLEDISFTNPITSAVTTVSLDVDRWSAGVGWHSGLSSQQRSAVGTARDRWGYFAEARYISFDADTGSTIDGYAAKIGARGVNSTNFEFTAAVGYEELEDADGELTVEARILYSITENFDVQLGVDWIEDFTRGFVGVRYNFSGFGG